MLLASYVVDTAGRAPACPAVDPAAIWRSAASSLAVREHVIGEPVEARGAIGEYRLMSLRCVRMWPSFLHIVGIGAACSTTPTTPGPPSPAVPSPAAFDDAVASDARVSAPALDAPPPVATLAVDAPAPPVSGALPPPFGVRWRPAVPGVTEAGERTRTKTPIVRHGEVFVSHGDTVTVFDLATGKVRRSAHLPHARLVGGEGALVATTATEEFGVDPEKLTPTWHAPTPDSLSLVALGDWILETPGPLQKQILRLRRASDGRVFWQLDERPGPSTSAQRFVLGQTLYVQLIQRVAAIDIPTGKTRWQKPGTLQSASGDRVAIETSPGQVMIVDADGREQWSASCSTILLHGNTAYATTDRGLAAIDLVTNTAIWRRQNLRAFASDDTWIYAWMPRPDDPSLDRSVVLAAGTGAVAAQISLSDDGIPEIAGGSATVGFGGKWVFAFGSLAQPEPLHAIDARICMIVLGCHSNTAPLVGGKVVLGGVAAITDHRGCFRFRARIGLAPLELAITGGRVAGGSIVFDTPLTDTVVLDGPALTLYASYIGGGCHDSAPGMFP